MPDSVIFDLDGVLLDSEQLWNEARESLVREAGGRWRDDAPRAMMGMNSREWSAYMRHELAVDLDVADISRDVVRRMERLYRAKLPLLPGAVGTVRSLQRCWPLGLASSSNREIIDLVLGAAGLSDAFVATVSSEEVDHGKPAPDVYLEATRRRRPESLRGHRGLGQRSAGGRVGGHGGDRRAKSGTTLPKRARCCLPPPVWTPSETCHRN